MRLRGFATKMENQDEAPYLIRSLKMKKEKRCIGQKAASLVKEGAVILLDVGSTIIEVLRSIINIQGVQIITHWIPVALECKMNKHYNVVILGGKVDLAELSIGVGGPEEMLRVHLHVFPSHRIDKEAEVKKKLTVMTFRHSSSRQFIEHFPFRCHRNVDEELL